MKPPPLPESIRYLGHLGRGGTADVARVHVDGIRRDVALKYPITNDEESNAVFHRLAERERSLVGDIRFPGLVQIIDHSELDAPYLLLELCEGPTLDRVETIDDVQKVLNILSALGLDLHFLKIHRLIHGDLKPQNVFLPTSWNETRDDQLFYLKLSDFSLGRRFDEPEDARGGLGTVGYMAPETLADGSCDHRSDLFAAGVIAYQLITGRHPFIDPNDADPVRTNSRVCETEPESPNVHRSDLHPGLTELILAMMHKDPSKRPASGWEVCTRLAECGATYPYKRALNPRYLLVDDCNYEEAIARTLMLSPVDQRRLDLVTEGDPHNLRVTLTVNFRRGNLTLKKDGFEFGEQVYWPHRLRRKTLDRYRAATFGERLRFVRTAIAGGQHAACKLGESEGDNHSQFDGLCELLLPLLKPSTVKTVSAQLGPRAEQHEMYEAATRLHLQAGNLEGAERCAFQAATTLNQDHQNEVALRLLHGVIEYARISGRTFAVRQLLMSRGDILKETGDAALALEAYNEIISLYEDQPADKLLAETYKDLGDLYKIKQDPVAGLSALEKGMQIYTDLGDELEISHTLNNIGNLQWVGADYAAALKCYRRALKIQRRHKAMDNVASTLSNIGSIFAVRGKLVRATHLLGMSIDICREIANQLEEARILNNLGYTYHLRGMPDDAVSCLERSLEINRKIGTKKEILFNLENLIAIVIGAGQLRQSVKYLEEGMALATELDDKSHLGAFTGDMGRTLKRLGRYREAEEHYLKAKSLYGEVEDPIGLARLEIGRADLRARIGEPQAARKMAVEILYQKTAVDDKPQELEVLLLLTRVTDEPEYLSRARELVAELKLKRESVLVEFNALSQSLRKGANASDIEQYKGPLEALGQMQNDIELPWMNNLAGELMIACERYSDAAIYLERSLKLAEDFGLLPEQADSQTLIGRVHLQSGDYESAFACFRMALETARKISEQISNPDDRDLFQNRPTITFLVAEIKKLAQLLAPKEKAGA